MGLVRPAALQNTPPVVEALEEVYKIGILLESQYLLQP
jgi:hypothetical protein